MLWVIFRAGQISDGAVGTGKLDDKVGEVLRGLLEGWGVSTCYVCVYECVCEERERQSVRERKRVCVFACQETKGVRENVGCEEECVCMFAFVLDRIYFR